MPSSTPRMLRQLTLGHGSTLTSRAWLFFKKELGKTREESVEKHLKGIISLSLLKFAKDLVMITKSV